MTPTESIVIARAEQIEFNDYLALHKLLVDAFAYMDDRIDPPSSLHKLNAESLRQKAEQEILLLALKDQNLLGCVFVRRDPDTYYLGKLAVRADCRGAGIAQKLIAKAEQLAISDGIKALVLETRVELVENHRFFEWLGFTQYAENAHKGFDRPTSFAFRKEV